MSPSRTVSALTAPVLLTLLALLLTTGPPAHAAGGAEQWDRFMTQALERTALTAESTPASAWVVIDGETVSTGGVHGATSNTRFVLGSLSKGVTAVAVLQLADRGLVDVNARAAQYLDPPEAGRLPGGPGSPVTVRQLLTHTAGGEFDYQNTHFEILSKVVEKAAGRSFAAQVYGAIFAPLGMWSSSASPAARRAAIRGNHLAFGIPVPADLDDDGDTAAGFIVTSADDYAAFLRMLLAGGVAADGTRLLSEESVRAMLAEQTSTPHEAAAPGTTGYGYGWGTGSTGEHRFAAHGGRASGTFSAVYLRPGGDQAVAVLQSADSWFYDQNAPVNAAVAAFDDGGPGSVDPAGHGRSGAATAAIYLGIWLVALLLVALTSVYRARRDRRRAPGSVRRGVRLGTDLVLATAVCVLWFAGAGAVLIGRPLDWASALFASWELTVLVVLLAALLVARAAVTGYRWCTSPAPGGRSA